MLQGRHDYFIKVISEAQNDGSLVTEFHEIGSGLRSPNTLPGNLQGKCNSILHSRILHLAPCIFVTYCSPLKRMVKRQRERWKRTVRSCGDHKAWLSKWSESICDNIITSSDVYFETPKFIYRLPS